MSLANPWAVRRDRIQLYGCPEADDIADKFRDFLGRTVVAFDWTPPETDQWAGELAGVDDRDDLHLPVCILPNGDRLKTATVASDARALGWLAEPRHELGGQTGTSSKIENSLGFPGGNSEAPLCRDQGVYVVGGGNSAGLVSMSRYLVDRIERRRRIEIRTCCQIVGIEGRDQLSAVTLRDNRAGGEMRAETRHVFAMLGGGRTPAGPRDWGSPATTSGTC